MWLSSVIALVLLADRGHSTPEPGLLRVPKVYNAVITSNQNLAPSRAYPVIQPVVHRTAIGYVPPFYYTHLAPGFVGPEVVPLDPGVLGGRGVGGGSRDGGGGGGGGGGREDGRSEGSGPPPRPSDVESVETTDSGPNSPPPRRKIARPDSNAEDVESSGELSSGESSEHATNDEKGKRGKNDRVPLSFYPNYQSLYYDPYFYPYNAFPPHLAAPGTYYVDYPQPPGILGPLPPPPPPLPIGPGRYPVGRPENPSDGSGQDTARRNEKQKLRSSDSRREKIPDVPPPPLPTVVRKKAS